MSVLFTRLHTVANEILLRVSTSFQSENYTQINEGLKDRNQNPRVVSEINKILKCIHHTN
jgi:hypothetical protein